MAEVEVSGSEADVTDLAPAATVRPAARPDEGGASRSDEPLLSETEYQGDLPLEDAGPLLDAAGEDPLGSADQELAGDGRPAPLLVDATREAGLQEIGSQLVEASTIMRDVDASTSRSLLAELDDRLDLLRRRQADEEILVQLDREEVARIKNLIDRGLVPQSEAADAERDLLLSSMQSYETSDAIARLEIEFARISADLERQPSEAAHEILLDLESQLAAAEVARAELNAIDQRLALLLGPNSSQTSVTFQFQLHRDNGSGTSVREVDQDEVLLPGDVLEVVTVTADLSR